MSENTKLTELIRQSLESIKDMVDCDTVMGDPINTPQGTVIIPVSKVSLGYASGGLDYFGKNLSAGDKKPTADLANFAGGGGVGLSVTPLGFLVVYNDGKTEFLSIAASSSVPTVVNIVDTAVDLIERSPEIVEKIKKIFVKDKKEENNE